MDCGKVCLPECKAKALALVSITYLRAYYCPDCHAWHTTSQRHRSGVEPTQYRLKLKRPLA